jgi:hypothetical protein
MVSDPRLLEVDYETPPSVANELLGYDTATGLFKAIGNLATLLDSTLTLSTYTPTVEGLDGMTISAHTVDEAYYMKIGALVACSWKLSLDTISSASAQFSLELPYAATNYVFGKGGGSSGADDNLVLYQNDASSVVVKKTSGNYANPENNLVMQLVYFTAGLIPVSSGELIGALGITKA